MIPINTTYAPIQAFVDELARCGLHRAVTCPGSRNAPIALTLAAHPEIEAVSVLDERSAGFAALGMAKASREPVAITTTSGTAAANLFPAVVEAHEARVPLIVLTADRPPELREVGAGQAIDQIKLYGDFAKWFCEVGNHPTGRASAIHHRQLGCRAYYTAADERPGPVHLNFPLRDPLAPVPEQGLDAEDWAGRRDRSPWTAVTASDRGRADDSRDLLDAINGTEHGIVVCGGGLGASASRAGLSLGARTGWPVFAEPTSGARGGHDADRGAPVVAHYDLLLRSERFAEANRPGLVVRLGEMPTSKPLRAWLEATEQVIIDPEPAWHDPTRSAMTISPSVPDGVRERAAGQWRDSWQAADALVGDLLAAAEEPFEPLAYNVLADVAETIWVSSSMPIRDFESYFPKTEKQISILANRGANGIDGVVSSAAGAALAIGEAVHLAIGELALLHDIGGLVTARRAGAELAILCVNNGGGGIFDFLPVAECADPNAYEQHIATPVEVDLAEAAALGGLEHRVVTTAAEVREHLRPGTLVELRISRSDSLRRHRELAAKIVGRLDAL